jgi:RNA polymerase sigma factor (sigma-70 family)
MTRSEYNRCVDEFADGIFRFVLKNLRDEDKARDVVQETFTKVWIKVDDVSYEKSKSYLFTTAYHTMIDMIRKDERQTRFDEKHLSGVVSYNSYSDLGLVLDEALGQLPEIQRTVILLRDYEGYAYNEIGEITGLTEAQVKVYIFRARQLLKKYIHSLDKVLEER